MKLKLGAMHQIQWCDLIALFSRAYCWSRVTFLCVPKFLSIRSFCFVWDSSFVISSSSFTSYVQHMYIYLYVYI
jgi:hypothetical protein